MDENVLGIEIGVNKASVMKPGQKITNDEMRRLALSDMKSAEKKLKDARTKQTKTREALAKVHKDVAEAKSRLSAAQELWES